MQRVIEEMSKAKSDVERRLRKCIPEIIRECSAFGYLGKNFTFDVSNLSDKVNQRLISLSDEILSDIEERARRASEYAEEEDEWTPLILPYITRQIGEEDMVQRLDKHCSTLRYFLEGWIAIGMVNKLQEYELTNNIFAYLDNPLASPLWKEALNAGYLSNAIRSGSYIYGKGNQRNVLKALTEIEQYAINESFQYGRLLHYGKTGAIGYMIHRGSTYDCPHCDSNCGFVIPLNDIRVPQHPRCVCWTEPVFTTSLNLTPEQKIYRKSLEKSARDKFRGKVVNNVFDITITRKGIKEFLNQPHILYFEKNELILEIDKVLSSAKYLGINESYNKEGVLASYIYETFIGKQKSWIIVRRYSDNSVSLHSISDNPGVAKNLKK